MKKTTPINGRLLVTSRGTKQGDIIIPEHNLKDSNVCKTEDGETVVCRDNIGYELGNHQRIILEEDVIATVHDGKTFPRGEWVLGRKCEDAEDDSGIIVSTTKNSNQFIEILAVGEETMLDDHIGWFGYIENISSDMQKVEETEADWLIKASSILMVVEPEE